MFMSSATSVRRARSSHEPWHPHAYQTRAVDFLCQQNSAALFLDPGLGKTAITLAAFTRLKATAASAQRMLVVAPLRVVQTVWQQEAQKWTQFRHLKFATLHGPKKQARLKDDADIWLINPEGCQWLSDQYFGRSLPWDTVVIDELTKFKNPKAVRHKALRPRLKNVRRRWGLTGTPIPNGYLDLFGQFLLLDDGAALGKYVTHYRDSYFQPDYSGFDYTLQPGGAARIEQRIAPYVLRMSAEDYLDLPPLVDDLRYVDLEPEARKTYARMKKDMLAELPEGTVTGANAAAVYSKLKQMSNGTVYLEEKPNANVPTIPAGVGSAGDDGAQRDALRSDESWDIRGGRPAASAPASGRRTAHLHDAKLDAIEELVEELCGAPLLLAYEFNHDLARLQKKFPNAPYIGSGVNGTETQAIVDAWNAGELPLLFAHPASAGHGLNLQGSGASHIAWFGPIWDLELYEQFIQRVHRQGTTSQRIVNHIFVARDTIDDLVMASLRDKSVTQEKLLANLTTEMCRDGASQPTEQPMNTQVRKLSRQGDAGAAPAEERSIRPRTWGAPANVPANIATNQQAQPAKHPANQPATAQAAPRSNGWGRPAAPAPEATQAAIDGAAQRQAIERKITQAPQQRDIEEAIAEAPPAAVRAREMFSQATRDAAYGPAEERGHVDGPKQEVTAAEVVEHISEPAPPKRTRQSRATATHLPPAVPETDADVALRERMLMLAAQHGSEENAIALAQKYVDFVRGNSSHALT